MPKTKNNIKSRNKKSKLIKNLKNKSKKNKNVVTHLSGGAGGRGEELLNVCLEACQIMTPLVRAIYNKLCDNLKGKNDKEISNIKADKTIFTIADGLVQYFLENVLFEGKFAGIVGEETVIVNINTLPYDVDKMIIPEEFNTIVESVLDKIKTLKNKLTKNYNDINVFIDPIDGTKEFATGKGYDSTNLIGFSYASDGTVWAGIVYRPIPLKYDLSDMNNYHRIKDDYLNSSNGSTYVYGCKSEGIYNNKNIDNSQLQTSDSQTTMRLVASNGSTSKFLNTISNTFSYSRAGGAGNKMLMLIEGKGEVYIQDRGLSRWDTCAPQAVIEAAGGVCSKLTQFLQHNWGPQNSKYNYQTTTIGENKDFDFPLESNQYPKIISNNMSVELTNELKKFLDTKKSQLNFNKIKAKFNKNETEKIIEENFTKEFLSNFKTPIKANFKEYSNLCGIVAFLYPKDIYKEKQVIINMKEQEYINKIYDVCKNAETLNKPSYD